MITATSRQQVLAGVQQFGVAPGARKMMDWEDEAADQALETGLYVTWRNREGQECTRVGPSARCFCGHPYAQHAFASRKSVYPRCTGCNCQGFAFIPQRPEEVGEWWLPRRKGFNVHTWRAKCRCGHGHDEHDPVARRCRCGCGMFESNFACLACDKKWEDHETVFETEQERAAAGRPTGDDYRPLASDSQIQHLVFPGGPGPAGRLAGSAATSEPNRLRRPQVPASSAAAEKSVRIMAASSGGAVTDQDVANRWGKVPAPPTGQQQRLRAQTPEQSQQVPRTAMLTAAGTGGGGGDLAVHGRQASRAMAASSSTDAVGAARGPITARPGSGQAPPRSGASGGPGPGRAAMGPAGPGGAPKTMASGFRPVYD